MKQLPFNPIFIHFGRLGFITSLLLLAAGLATGCKPKSSAPPPAQQSAVATEASRYFQTAFQSECGFIVHAIGSDLAEQMYYAANHRLPDEKSFSVSITEKPGASLEQPVYALQIRLDAKLPELNCDVAI